MWHVTLADVSNDGKLDILTANKGDNSISILLGNGDGTFQPQIVIPVGTRPGRATVADVNGDGIPDLIVDNYADDYDIGASRQRQRHISELPVDLAHTRADSLARHR